MQHVFFWSVFSLFILPAMAQKQANIWYFGNNLGLDFNTLPPQVLYDGKITTDASRDSESAAVMSDAEGQLLFYTDGANVWNRLHQRMPNGAGLWGSGTTTQTLIVPRPGHPQLYYIFTASPRGDMYSSFFPAAQRGFRYALVDMSLEQGLGNVIEKNTLLVSSTTERVVATFHANGEDIWVVMHEWRSNAFRTYRISPQGIAPNPVVSAVGLIHTGQSGNTSGQMKFSPDGQLLAVDIAVQPLVQVFRFDPVTGVLSLTETLSDFNEDLVYGLEFSPTGRFLYVSGARSIFQFDLQARNVAQSRVLLETSQLYGDASQLQLAPDGKIYAARHGQPYLGIVQQPDQAGQACRYEPETLSLRTGSICNTGLPNFLSGYLATVGPVLEMPNVFTPNGDAANPKFSPIHNDFIRRATVHIYNRWGKLVYETDDLEKGWDGSNCATGTYYWSVAYEGINKKSYFQKGLLQLLR